ncbi:MAG: LysR family transcriptional regulator [Magnetococcales bacterium]|nr:LysR family transcriptional regulator [Magnetococcales bacterium]
MNLRQIEYVLAVAKERNFIRAAQICHVSQPSLSVAVKALEDELGLPLFERARGEIRITRQGMRVVDQMRLAMEEVARIKSVAKSGAEPLSGSLRIGAIFTVGPYLFPGLAGAFHAVAPRMKLLLEENFTTALTERLKRGDLDAIIVALPFQELGINTLPLYDEPFMLAVPTGHPWEVRNDLRGSELANSELILLGKGHCFRDQVLDICPECMRLEEIPGGMRNVIEGTSLETVRHMVASGVGVSVMPVSTVKSLLCNVSSCPVQTDQRIRYVSFAPPLPSRRIVLACRASFPNPEAIDTLLTALTRSLPQGVIRCDER